MAFGYIYYPCTKLSLKLQEVINMHNKSIPCLLLELSFSLINCAAELYPSLKLESALSLRVSTVPSSGLHYTTVSEVQLAVLSIRWFFTVLKILVIIIALNWVGLIKAVYTKRQAVQHAANAAFLVYLPQNFTRTTTCFIAAQNVSAGSSVQLSIFVYAKYGSPLQQENTE